VNCVVAGWIATPRGLAEAAAMTPQEREAAGPLVPMQTIVRAVIDLIRDDAARGRYSRAAGPRLRKQMPARGGERRSDPGASQRASVS
jgi:hypothetical protein